MPDSIRLILSVQKYPVLYEKTICYDYHQQEDLWETIAKKCDIHSGFEANKLWIDLVKGYIDYLRDGTNFDYENEMLFLQTHLITSLSDSDELDEDELQRVLDSDSEASNSNPSQSPVKRKHISMERPLQIRKKKPKFMKNMTSTPAANAKENTTADSSTVIESSSAVPANVSGLSSLQLIFLGYAKILQDLPLEVQIKTKHKIAQIMNEAEMSILEDNDGGNAAKSVKQT